MNKVIMSWAESIDFLWHKKAIKQLLEVTYNALKSMLLSLLGPLMLLFTYLAFKLIHQEETTQYFILFNFSVAMLCFAVAGLRPSIENKTRYYYLSMLLKLLPIFLFYTLGYIFFLSDKYMGPAHFYKMLYLLVGSPLVVLYLLFLLDAPQAVASYFSAFQKACYFCMLNAPILLLNYVLFGVMLFISQQVATLLPELIVIRLLAYAVILFLLFLPYWALLSSVYIKRMHDHIDYYY